MISIELQLAQICLSLVQVANIPMVCDICKVYLHGNLFPAKFIKPLKCSFYDKQYGTRFGTGSPLKTTCRNINLKDCFQQKKNTLCKNHSKYKTGFLNIFPICHCPTAIEMLPLTFLQIK